MFHTGTTPRHVSMRTNELESLEPRHLLAIDVQFDVVDHLAYQSEKLTFSVDQDARFQAKLTEGQILSAVLNHQDASLEASHRFCAAMPITTDRSI